MLHLRGSKKVLPLFHGFMVRGPLVCCPSWPLEPYLGALFEGAAVAHNLQKAVVCASTLALGLGVSVPHGRGRDK